MPIDLDGMAVLAAVSKRPDVFPNASDAINELAHQTIKTRIAGKDLSLGLLREIATMLQEADLLQVLDSLSPAAVGKLAKKLDKENAELNSADARQHRHHVVALATSKAEPAPKQVKTKINQPKAPRAPASNRKVKRTLSSKAMAASFGGKTNND